jgi:hypothetical protein
MIGLAVLLEGALVNGMSDDHHGEFALLVRFPGLRFA